MTANYEPEEVHLVSEQHPPPPPAPPPPSSPPPQAKPGGSAAPAASTTQADLELQRAVLSGDRRAQHRFVLAFSTLFRKVVQRTIRWYGAAWTDMTEDLVQEAFCDLLNPRTAALADWRPELGRSLKNYLCVFVRLRTSARLRRRQSPQFQPPIPEESITRYLGGDPTVLGRIEDRSLLKFIIEQLRSKFSERDMRIFDLSFFADRSATEIAEEIGISTELVFTVRYRLRQSLFALRDELLFGAPEGK